jgi:N-acetylmuramoyl-L-alanine amidase
MGSSKTVLKVGAAAARTIAVMLLLLAPMAAHAQDQAPASSSAEPAPPDGADAEGLPSIIGVRVATTTQRARMILDLTGKTDFATATLDQPNRIAIEIKALSVQFDDAPPVAGEGIVGSYTIEVAQEGLARATLNLKQPALVQQAYVLDAVGDQPARLVVDLVLANSDDFANQVADDYAASLNKGTTLARAAPPATAPQRASTTVAWPPAAQPTVAPTSEGAATPAAPPAVSAPSAPLSKPLVVIDPGHGGIDNGASAPNGVHEKDIVLAFALELQDVLVKSGRFDVALTREDDSFLRLEERVALARQNKADLFISIHADTFQQSDIRGASVYVRDDRATDVLDKVLADNENKADIVAGYAMPDAPPQVVDILVDLMRRQMRQQSYMAAQDIVDQLEPSIEVRRFPVRQADFFVLQAPDVPSILIELGFLSNAADVANLQKNDWRDKAVDALSRGVGAYFDTLKDETTAAK